MCLALGANGEAGSLRLLELPPGVGELGFDVQPPETNMVWCAPPVGVDMVEVTAALAAESPSAASAIATSSSAAAAISFSSSIGAVSLYSPASQVLSTGPSRVYATEFALALDFTLLNCRFVLFFFFSFAFAFASALRFTVACFFSCASALFACLTRLRFAAARFARRSLRRIERVMPTPLTALMT